VRDGYNTSGAAWLINRRGPANTTNVRRASGSKPTQRLHEVWAMNPASDPTADYASHYYREFLPALAQNTVAALAWQLAVNKWLLILVIFLTLCGVALAGVQLYWSRSILDKVKNVGEVGSAGIKVTSPFVGLLILVVSFGFFYLYVKEVYKLDFVHLDAPSAVQKPQ
jgi:hypothetical protein